MTASGHHNEYNEDFITALQWMWGDGYLSPGGPREYPTAYRRPPR